MSDERVDDNTLPLVIQFSYLEYTVFVSKEVKHHKAKCTFCKKSISDKFGTTSGFTRHLRTQHAEKYKEYEKTKKHPKAGETQPKLTSFSKFGTQQQTYTSNHPRQRVLTQSIVENLIVGCDLPVSLVENEKFRKFMADVDCHYVTPCRKTVTDSCLPTLLQLKKDAVKAILDSATDVAVTVDIWSDRRQHSFLGVTAHTHNNGTVKTQLIHFKSFSGSHTGARIAEVLEEVFIEENLRSKVHFVITDNASNMKKAATFLFRESEVEDDGQGSDLTIMEDEGLVDDPTLFEDVTLDELGLRQDVLSGERLPCFAHSLQLTVRDGLQKTAVSRPAVAKCTKLANLTHQSTTFKGSFEQTFGKNRSIPLSNDTRWNSFYRLLNAIVKLDRNNLADVLRKTGQTNLIMSQREYQQVNELVIVLQPFSEATDIVQGSNSVTVSHVVPVVMSLTQKLTQFLSTMQFHLPLVKELLRSLYERFRGIFELLGLPLPPTVVLTAQSAARNLQFTSDVYVCAAVLDPMHGFRWLDYCSISVDAKEALKHKILGMLLNHLSKTTSGTAADAIQDSAHSDDAIPIASQSPSTSTGGTTVSEEQPSKKPRVSFFGYSGQAGSGHGTGLNRSRETPASQLTKYLTNINSSDCEADEDRFKLPAEFKLLCPLFNRLFCIPATSAPVERIFSHSGIIMRPHRTRLSNELLETLMFLKCNQC